MKAKEYWQLFMETGAPEAYIAYHRAKKLEDKHVFKDTGPGSPGYGL